MNKPKTSQSIFIIGFPKSGNTWLTRLIADSLRMRVGSGMRVDDDFEIATSVNTQLGLPGVTDFTIRKTHFLPEVLKKVREEDMNKGVYIYRDFRDIVISSFFYKYGVNFEKDLQKRKKNLLGKSLALARKMFYVSKGINLNELLLEHTITISKAWADDVGSWSLHIHTWVDFNNNNSQKDIVFVSYEDLLSNTLKMIKEIINGLKIPMPSDEHLQDAITRQSIEQQKKYFESIPHKIDIPQGKDYNIKFFRKGIAGDWKDYFTQEMGEIVEHYHGEMLRRFGYVQNKRWYQDI